MDVELQNPALSLCSWKHADTEMFGAITPIVSLLMCCRCTDGSNIEC